MLSDCSGWELNWTIEGRTGKEVLGAAIDVNSPEMVKLFIDDGVEVNSAFFESNGTSLKKAAVYNS